MYLEYKLELDLFPILNSIQLKIIHLFILNYIFLLIFHRIGQIYIHCGLF